MAEPNAFAGFDPTGPDEKAAAATLAPKANGADNAFAGFNPIDDQEEQKTSGIGAFVRGAVGGAAPAAAALRGGFYGAEIGAATPIPGGAFAGAVIGGLAGSFLTDEAQSWLLDKVPRFRDLLGQSEEQKAQDQKEHQALSFMGGLFPYAITMSPAAALGHELPANATNFQKLLNNQYTARLMSAGVVGGMQLGQEAVEQDHVNWSRVAIATGFGLIFNKPNRFGEKISGIPARAPTAPPPPPIGMTEAEMAAHYEALPGHDVDIPTLAQISDTTAGPGFTEDAFMGSEARNPAAEMAAQHAASVEDSVIGPERRPDLENTARQMEPELFERYDAAQNRLAAARKWIRQFSAPTPEEIEGLQTQRDDLERQLTEHLEARPGTRGEMVAGEGLAMRRGGYAGTPTARRLRAEILGVQREIDLIGERATAFREGRAVETADTAAARKEITDANAELIKIQPEIRAAYNAAANYTGAPIVAPPAAEPLAAAPQPAPPAGLPAPAVAATAEPAVAAAPSQAPQPAPAVPAATRPPIPEAVAPQEQQAAIAKTAYSRMVAVGEPPERAEWLSRLEALATSVRAARFGGALGNAADVYAREGVKYGVYRPNGPVFEVTPPPAQPNAPLPTNQKELAAYLAAGGKVEPEKKTPGARPALVVPPPEPPRVPEAIARKIKMRGEGYAPIVAQHEKSGMVDNADALKAAAKKRSERGGGTVELMTTAEKMAREGTTVKEANEEYTKATKRFDEYLTEKKLVGDPELERLRPLIVERLLSGFEPEDAIDLATAKDALERNLIDDPEARQAAEDFAAMEEGHGFFGEVPPTTHGGPTETGQKGQGPGAEGVGAAGESAREVGAEQDVDEYFQRRGLEPYDPLAGAVPFTGKIKSTKNITFTQVFSEDGGTIYRRQHKEGGFPTFVATDASGQSYEFKDYQKAEQWVAPPEVQRPEAAPGETPPWEDEFFQAAKGGKKVLGGIRLEANGLSTILRDVTRADASTIIHELGHHWLSTLLRDSLHPLAPQQLRDDAAAALKYLGVKSGGKLTTKAQERWATGVEQYFYEGRAPAPELVPLFDRFKNWLRDVYKTVKDIVTAQGEHYPINEEFRGIMDRLLTMPDGETVIAPESQARGPTLQDIHEADAKLTEPQEGEQAAYRVEAERDRYDEELPPQVKTGLEAAAIEAGAKELGRAEPAGQGQPMAGRGGEVVGRGGPTEPPAGSGAGGEEPGKIVEGGTPARPESTPLPAAGERGRTEREHPLATGPAPDAIPPGETKLVDKAGNIRLENVTNVEQSRQAMRESAERNDDFREAQGDSVTDGQLWNLSTELGQDPKAMSYDALRKHLEFLLGGTRDMAKKVLAARRMLKQSADDVAALAKQVAQSWSDDDALDFAIAVTKHDMIQSDIAGATASWGRTGRAFRDITEGWDVKGKNANATMMAQTGKTLFQIKQMASLMAEYDNVNQISRFIRDGAKPRYGRMVTEYWINGLISGIQTHMTYAIGNTILALEKIGPETATAAAIGAVRRAMGREGETVRIREVAAGFRGIARGFAPALHSSLEALRTGATTLLPGEEPSATLRFQAPLSQLASQAVLNESAKFSDVMESAYGIVRGIRDAVKAGAALQQAGGRPDAPIMGWEFTPNGAIPNFQVRGGTVLPVGDIARLPSRMVAAIHSFFRPLNYSIEIQQQAYREALNQNLQGAHFDSAVAGYVSNPPLEAMEAAHNISNDQTLMGGGGEWVKKLSNLINHEFLGEKDPTTGKRIPGTGWPFLKFIDPFVHISSNIITEALVKRTPIGLAPALFGKETPLIADLMGRNGNVRADIAAARMLTGTALTILFGSLAAEGYVTGSEPSNPQDAALWRQVYQAHSVRVGDTWYAMNRLGPMGMLLSTAADLYQVAHMAEQHEFTEAAAALHHAVSQNILDESFMRGPSDLIKALEEPGRYGASYVRNFVSSFVPFSVAMSQMARNLDPYTRQARTMTDAIVAKTPLLSQSLFPRRDIWGEPLPSRYGLGADATAIWEKQVNADPVNRVLLDRGIKVAMVERKIRNVQLTPEQYDDYARISGRLTKLNLDRLILSPSFAQMPRGTQHDIIVENMRQSRETAKNMMFMKYQSLLVDAHDVKMRRREGPK